MVHADRRMGAGKPAGSFCSPNRVLQKKRGRR